MFIVQGALQFKDKTKYQHKETNITLTHSWKKKKQKITYIHII